MEPFLGEIRMFALAWAPRGWLACHGQLLAISQNTALFSLLGTMHGGDGRVTFALPDLRDRAPVHASPTYPVGTRAGERTHTLTVSEIPQHIHSVTGRAQATTSVPTGASWAGGTRAAYGDPGSTPMHPAALAASGGSQPHENMPPFLAVTFCIAVAGIFPPRN